MIKLFPKYILPSIIICLSACDFETSKSEQPGPDLFPKPKSFPKNTKEGYVVNPSNGDTIQPIINSLGDTLKTGIAIPSTGKTIPADSIAKPIHSTAKNPYFEKAHKNVHLIPEGLTSIQVNENQLVTTPLSMSLQLLFSIPTAIRLKQVLQRKC